MNMKHYMCLALLVLIAQAGISQTGNSEVFASAGDYFTNASASLSWTMGEPLIETASDQNILTQGFQQPNAIVLAGLDNVVNPVINVTAYPNPVTSSVFISSSINKPLLVNVMDMQGRTLATQSFTDSNNNEVNMSAYAAGIYLLKVSTLDGQLMQTVRIEKTK